MVWRWEARTAPTPALSLVTGAADPASVLVAGVSPVAEAVAIAIGDPTAHTPTSAATRAVNDALRIMPSWIMITG